MVGVGRSVLFIGFFGVIVYFYVLDEVLGCVFFLRIEDVALVLFCLG